MQVIENKADVTGEISKIAPHPTLPGMMSVEARIDGVEPVAGFPNLLDPAKGTTIAITMPQHLAAAFVPGKPMKIRAQLRGPGKVFSFESP